MKLIAGLGNPGPKYLLTRHNLGFMVVDAVAARFRVAMTGKAHHAHTGHGRIAGVEAVLAKPQTFMNLSGQPVVSLMKAEGAGPADLIIVHDDLDLPLGRLKIARSGGDGGHNGVASVIAELGTGEFVRLRVGVGRPTGRMDPAEYVLSPFLPEEEGYVADVINYATDALIVIVRNGDARAMNMFNRKPAPRTGGDDEVTI